MYKISRKSLNYIVGALVGIGIGSFGGVGVSTSVSMVKNSSVFTTFRQEAIASDDDLYGVYLYDDTAVIVPKEYLYIYTYDNEGNTQRFDAFGDNIVLFKGDNELSAYDKAYYFASTFAEEENIINYVDIFGKSLQKTK